MNLALPIIFLCYNEYEIAHRYNQLTIALSSIIWVLYKSDQSSLNKNSSEVLLNYILLKLESLLGETHQMPL